MLSGRCLEVWNNFLPEFPFESAVCWDSGPLCRGLGASTHTWCLLPPLQDGVLTVHFLAPDTHTPPAGQLQGAGPRHLRGSALPESVPYPRRHDIK